MLDIQRLHTILTNITLLENNGIILKKNKSKTVGFIIAEINKITGADDPL